MRMKHGSGLPHDRLERRDTIRVGCFERNPRSGIERDQIHLGIDMRQQLHHAAGVGVGVVDAVEQHVLEGQLLPRAQRIGAAGGDQIL